MTTHAIQFGRSHRPAHHHAAHHHHTASHVRGQPTAEQRHDALVDQTQKWVSQTFFGQLLKQMRDSPFKSKLFDGGRGGEAFQQMADQRTADNMARGTGHKLVDAIVSRIEARAAYGNAPAVPGQDRGRA